MFFVLLFVFLAFPVTGVSQSYELFRIGTGGKTGVYYPIGKLIAQGLTDAPREKDKATIEKKGLPNYIGVAQNSAGSVENMETVVSGETEAGLVQSDVAFRASQSMGPFSGTKRFQAIRAVASLYPEKFQIVTRKDANIRSVYDLKGKRISLDEQGSGTLSVMRIILEAYGLSENDLRPVYLKPVFTHDKMKNGELQGFVIMAGTPMDAVLSLHSIGVSLVPVDGEIADKIKRRYPYLVPGKIAADVYPGITETPTVQVHALLVVSAEMDDDLVYLVTASLWSNHTQTLLKQGHPQGKAITLQTALTGLSIPLHPGAERYYREYDRVLKETD
jgi:hypothetical protein